MGKNPPVMRMTWVRSLGWEDPLEKGNATHSSILDWRIPWIVYSMGSQRVRQDIVAEQQNMKMHNCSTVDTEITTESVANHLTL